MRAHWWQLEAGEIIVLLLGAGWGLVWILLGFGLAMTGILGTAGSGSWNVPGPSLDPLGIVRTLLLLPIYTTLFTLSLLVRLGLHPSMFFAIGLALFYGEAPAICVAALLLIGIRVRT